MTTYSRDTINKPATVPQTDFDVMPQTDKAKVNVEMVGTIKLKTDEPDINVLNPPELQSIPIVPPANPEAK